MAIWKQRVQGVTVLRLGGAYYGGKETEELQRAIEAVACDGGSRLVVNLSECEMMNSTALGALIEARRACRARGGDLKLCGAEKRMRTVLSVTHLGSYFDHYATAADAVEAFTKSGAAA